MDIENKKTSFSVFLSIVSLGITILIDFFISPYIVRNLGAEANGYVQIANNFITFASLLTLALNSMGGRALTICHHKASEEETSKIYSSLIVGNFLIFIILFLPALFCLLKLENIIEISNVPVLDTKILFLFAFINFFVTQSVSLFSIGPFSDNKLYISYSVKIICTCLKAILYIAIFLIFEPKIFYITLIALVVSVFQMTILFIVKKRRFSFLKFKFSYFSFSAMLELIKSGIWNTLNQCGNILMTGFDLLIANWFVDPFSMGVLSVSKTIPNVVTQLSTEVNNSFLSSQTVSYASSNDKQNYLEEMLKSVRFSMFLISAPLGVFVIFSYKFYVLWQPTLDPKSLSILSILSILALIPLSGVQILFNTLTSMNKLKVNSLSFLICGVLNVCIVIILLKFTNLSIYAIAGVSSILSFIRSFCILLPYISKQFNKKFYFFYKYILLAIFCFAISAGLSFLVLLIIKKTTWFYLILSVLISALLSYASLFFILYNKISVKIIRKIFGRAETK